jgi:hypothetical protein
LHFAYQQLPSVKTAIIMAIPLPGPSDWNKVITFEPTNVGDKTGLVSFQDKSIRAIVWKPSTPVAGRNVTPPYDCSTPEEARIKGRGNLSFAVTHTEDSWKSIHGFDQAFLQHLLKNSNKFFNAKDAAFFAKDPSAISLKYPKPLARSNADGSADSNSLIRFRITGRGDELQSFEVNQGREGSYATNLTWRDRIDALPYNATRFLKVTDSSKTPYTVASLLRRKGPLEAGSHKMRHVGPGDMQNPVIHEIRFRVSHYADVNGAMSVILAASLIVFENRDVNTFIPDDFRLVNKEDESDDESVSKDSPKVSAPLSQPPEVKRDSKRARYDTKTSDPRVKIDFSSETASTWSNTVQVCHGCSSNSHDQREHMHEDGGCLAPDSVNI